MGILKKSAAQKKKKAIKKEVRKAVKSAPNKAAKKQIKAAGKAAIKQIKPALKAERKKTLGKVARAALIPATGGASLLLKKENRQKAGAIAKKVGGKIGSTSRKVGSKLEAGLKKAVGVGKDVAFAPLLPFKKVMEDALAKRGISHNGKLHEIAPKFLQNVVRGSFENSYEQNYHIDGAEIITSYDIDGRGVAQSAAKGSGLVGIAGKAATGDIAGAASGLIAEILNYIRKLKDKKDKAREQMEAGLPVTDPLSPAEEGIIDGAEQVGEQLQDIAAEEIQNSIAFSVKDFLFSWKGAVALGVLVILIILAVKKFK